MIHGHTIIAVLLNATYKKISINIEITILDII